MSQPNQPSGQMVGNAASVGRVNHAAAAAATTTAVASPALSDSPTTTATTASATTVVKKKRKRDLSLDFFSAEFDPLKALNTPGLAPPLPLPPLSDWSECESLLTTDRIYDDMITAIDAATNPTAPTTNSVATAASNQQQLVHSLQSALPLAIEDGSDDALMQDRSGSSPAPASLGRSSPLLLSNRSPSSFSSTSSDASRRLNAILNSAAASALASGRSASPGASSASAFSPRLNASGSVSPIPYLSPYLSPSPIPSDPSLVSATAGADSPTARGGSKMSAELVQQNHERAEKRTKENAEKKAKQNHYIERFTSQFPVPKPISTAHQRAKAEEGPMFLLRSFHTRHLRVYVSIRASHTMRSILHGYLIAFDKHWNLIMMDIDEEYTEWEWHKCGKKTIKNLEAQGIRYQLPRVNQVHDEVDTMDTRSSSVSPAANASTSSSTSLLPTPSSTSSSSSTHPSISQTRPPHPPPPTMIRTEVLKQRHLNQLYIRGDSVIAVSELKPKLLRPPQEDCMN